MATPKPWEPGVIPTSEEFTGWFLEQPRDEQAAIMSTLLNDARTAAACWQQDHGSIIATLEALEARFADLESTDLVKLWRDRAHRYRDAWRSARRGRHAFRGAWDELVRQTEALRGLQTVDAVGEVPLFAVDADPAAPTLADFVAGVEVELATTYADYVESDGSPKPSGYCVDSMVSGPADHARCQGRGHLGQPCGCPCHDQPAETP